MLRGSIDAAQLNPATQAVIAPPLSVTANQRFSAAAAQPARIDLILPAQVSQIRAHAMQIAVALTNRLIGAAHGVAPRGAAGDSAGRDPSGTFGDGGSLADGDAWLPQRLILAHAVTTHGLIDVFTRHPLVTPLLPPLIINGETVNFSTGATHEFSALASSAGER